MSWINANLTGTKQVFAFTARQFLKTGPTYSPLPFCF